ncbi:ABC transporter ATP-binding protein [Bacillota bacterium LCP21S3_D8]
MLHKITYVLTKAECIKLVILFFLVAVGSVLELLGISVFSPLISLITNPSIVQTNQYLNRLYIIGKFTNTEDFLAFIIVFIIFVYICKNAYLIFEKNIVYKYIYNVQRRISVKLLRCYLNEPYAFFLTKNSSVLQRSLQSDTDNFVKAIKHFVELTIEVVTCTVIILYLFMVSHSMTVIIAGILILMVAFFVTTTKKKTKILGVESQEYKAQIFQYMNQALGGVKEIKVLNREKMFLDKYDKAFEKYTYASRISEIIGMMPKYCVEASCMAGLLLAILVKMFWGQKELIEFIPQLTVFAVASFRLLPSVGRINQYYTWILYEQPSIDLIYHDIKEVENVPQKNQVNAEWKLENQVKISNISFHYPNVEKDVLSDVSLSIKKGTTIAFIGTSGAGKSTLADIILGLLTPQLGKIYADDLDVLKNISTWQQEIGYIPQSIYLSDDSIRNNIAFGIPENQIDDERIKKAAEQAQLTAFIDILPDGFNTFVGDRGIRLSGGQRQRIGIARALYNDPEILILDEATSALDNDTESAVMSAINDLHGKKTLLIIAHRLTTIRQADYIYEVKGGTVIERKKEEVLKINQ